MRKCRRAGVPQRSNLIIRLHNDVEVDAMDKATDDFTPAQAAVHELRRAMPDVSRRGSLT
jgi:hypothetical protein